MRKKIVKDVKLPQYPSQLLQLALDDIAVIKKDKRYKINTGVWHNPNKKTCSVCLSGAVLANTLKLNSNIEVSFPHEFKYEIGGDNCIKLVFIDTLRRLDLVNFYDEYRNFLKKLHLTDKEMEMIEKCRWKILKKLDEIKPRNYEHEDIFCFRSFKKSHEFYSSIVEELEYLDEKILGRKKSA